jgi:hypothetical protein
VASASGRTAVGVPALPPVACAAVPEPEPGGALPTIGVIAHARSGTDARRMLTPAGRFTLEEKVSIVRRVARGAVEGGARRLLGMPEPQRIVGRATATERALHTELLDMAVTFTEGDTVRAAAMLRDAGCAVVVVLGGDGTNRAVALGWPDAPVIPLSTGTNNAFPIHIEPTVAGVAAGLLAVGAVPLAAVSRPAKVVRIRIDAGGGRPASDDLALVDVVTIDEVVVGSLEPFHGATLGDAVVARAEPHAVGVAGTVGLIRSCRPDADGGVHVRFAPPGTEGARRLRAPLGPGWFDDVHVASDRALGLGEEVVVEGPCLLALDGERHHRLEPGQRAVLCVERDGPRVVDVRAVLAAAADGGLLG